MDKLIKNIEIQDFINIRILDLNSEDCVYFAEKYNEKYFYMKDNNKLSTCQYIPSFYSLYFQKANIIHRSNLNGLEQDVYNLYKQLTFSIPRAENNSEYYSITSCFEVDNLKEKAEYLDNVIYNSFNYFVSKEEAKKCAKKLKEYLIELRKEDYANRENKELKGE